MNRLEARLEQALKAGAPPRDPMFRARLVVCRQEQAFHRRLLVSAGRTVGIAVPASLALGAVAGRVGSGPLWMGLVAAVGVVLVISLMVPHAGPFRALPREQR